MNAITSEMIAALMLGGTVVAWLFGLQSRIKTQERVHEDYVKANDKDHMQHAKRIGEIREDVTYIRTRIDQALSYGRHTND